MGLLEEIMRRLTEEEIMEGEKEDAVSRFERWAGKTLGRQITVYGSIALGATLVIVSFFFFRGDPQIFTVLNVVGGVIAIGPSSAIKYREYRRLKAIERVFPQFLNDIVEGTNAGQTLPQAIKSASQNQYGPLTPYVDKMAAQIDWGVPFDKILHNFADEMDSPLLRRTVSTIVETHRSGGNISDVLQAVSESVTEIDRIRAERKSRIYSQTVTGYTIYFVFLGVILGMQKFLLPTLLFSGGGGGVELGITATEGLVENYQFMFQNLIVIQGAFSGLAIGKMSEGSLVAGIKHIVVLLSVGFMAIVLLF